MISTLDLCKIIRDKHDYLYKDVSDQLVKRFFELVREEIESGNRVVIYGYGTFFIKKIIFYQSFSLNKTKAESSYKIKFNLSRVFKDRFNGKT